MLGMLGLPVFANYASGAAVLAWPNRGYLIGFIAMWQLFTIVSNYLTIESRTSRRQC